MITEISTENGVRLRPSIVQRPLFAWCAQKTTSYIQLNTRKAPLESAMTIFATFSTLHWYWEQNTQQQKYTQNTTHIGIRKKLILMQANYLRQEGQLSETARTTLCVSWNLVKYWSTAREIAIENTRNRWWPWRWFKVTRNSANQ